MANIHIIIAHPNLNSLNYAMKDAAISALNDSHTIVTSDLYAMHRNNHPAILPYDPARQGQSMNRLAHEQNIIKNSQLTIIQFPLYWFSYPGLLKNYWDQILTPGFAYPGKFNGSPLNDGRRVLLSLTTQSTEQDYSDEGCNGPIKDILYPMTVALRFAGFNILEPFVTYNVHDSQHEQLNRVITNYQKALTTVMDDYPLWLSV
jgi:NAD(P)H dehydrogenase (quinone)